MESAVVVTTLLLMDTQLVKQFCPTGQAALVAIRGLPAARVPLATKDPKCRPSTSSKRRSSCASTLKSYASVRGAGQSQAQKSGDAGSSSKTILLRTSGPSILLCGKRRK